MSELDRLLAPVEPVRVAEAAPDMEDPVWLHADGWRVLARLGAMADAGDEIARFRLDDGTTASARFDGDVVHVPFAFGEAYDNLVLERWTSIVAGGLSRGHLSASLLDLFYRVKPMIPRPLQLDLRRRLMRRRGATEFPAWPFEPSVVELLRLYCRCACLAVGGEITFRWFWPNAQRAALVLTHDVESAEGLRLAVELADREEERGLRSSFNVVADWYPIDDGILRELAGRGFELGVHGVHHDRSMFASREAFDAQQPVVRAAAERWGATGFRSPATHRIVDWLADLPTDYDCTVPFTDPYEALIGGCCTPWPYFIGDLVELPYTLPQDHTLFTLLREQTTATWRAQLERLERCHGLAQVVTHPDPGYLGDAGKRRLYVEFLDHVLDREHLWRPLPRDVAAWWRARAAGSGAVATARLAGDGVELIPPP